MNVEGTKNLLEFAKEFKVKNLISLIEKETKKAKINKVCIQKGDVPITYANISKAKKLLN